MRENKAFMVFLVGFVMFIGSVFRMDAGPLWAADPVKPDLQAPQAVNVGYLKILSWKVRRRGKKGSP